MSDNLPCAGCAGPSSLAPSTSGQGDYELKAEAYRAGLLVASKVITVAVQNTDSTPPFVTLSSPADGSIVQGNVTLKFGAAGSIAAASMQTNPPL